LIRRNPIMSVVVVLMILYMLLLVSGYRLLINEREWMQNRGGSMWLRGEDLGQALTCTYFTGRSIQTVEYRYDDRPDECPFLYRPVF